MKTGDVIYSKNTKRFYIAFEAGDEGIINNTFYSNLVKTKRVNKFMLGLGADSHNIFKWDESVENNTGINILDILKEALEDVS